MHNKSKKIKRLNKFIQKNLSYIINNELKFSSTNLITITSVITNSDLSTSKVFITTLNEEKNIIKILNKSTNKLRGLLSNSAILNKVPKLIFVEDLDIKNQIKINNLIDTL